MNLATRALCWAYVLGCGIAAWCCGVSARQGAAWYAIGLFVVSILLLGAMTREYIAADDRRAEAVKAERAARLRAREEARAIQEAAAALGHACCERWWTSCGFHHDGSCTRKDQAA